MTTIDKDRSGLLNQTIDFSLRNRLIVAFVIILASIMGRWRFGRWKQICSQTSLRRS